MYNNEFKIMYIGEGHVLNFPTSISFDNMCADIQTSYINTTGKCLLLNFRWITFGLLEIYLRSEDKRTTKIKELSSSTQPQKLAGSWQHVFIALPSSRILHQLIVKFVKPETYSRIPSGVAIDDLSVRPCSDFGKCILIQSQKICKLYNLLSK